MLTRFKTSHSTLNLELYYLDPLELELYIATKLQKSVRLSVGLLVVSISLYAFMLVQTFNHVTAKCVRFRNNNA